MDIEEKSICYECIGEPFLKAEIEKEGKITTCSYCGNDELGCYSLPFLADRVDTAFEQHYDRQSEYPPDDWSMYRLKHMDEPYTPDGTLIVDAIEEAVYINQEIAKDIQQYLQEKHYSRSAEEIGETSEYDSDLYYDSKSLDGIEWQERWQAFEHGVKTKARFFNKQGAAHLTSVFDGVEKLNTHDHRSVVKTIGPETDLTNLFRARAFQSDGQLKKALESPDKEIGPPPSNYASAGRMNANGISVFYGATRPETALAEIRPPVGSNVVVAKFDLLRPLKMLDLSALTYSVAKGSIFDEKYADLLSKTSFLRKLSQRMTKPILPNDENFEYLPTQVIADFLGSELEFDGIIFPSAQSEDGLNVALFNQASRVRTLKYSDGSNLRVDLYDWDDDIEVPSYSITAEIPKASETVPVLEEDHFPAFGSSWTPIDPDSRIDSLAIHIKSIGVEYIKSVAIQSTSFDVGYFEYKLTSDVLKHDPFTLL